MKPVNEYDLENLSKEQEREVKQADETVSDEATEDISEGTKEFIIKSKKFGKKALAYAKKNALLLIIIAILLSYFGHQRHLEKAERERRAEEAAEKFKRKYPHLFN